MGAGVQTSVNRFRTDQLTLKFRPSSGDNEWDYSLGVGFNLGVYKSWDKFSVGAAYKSRQWNQGFNKYDDLISDSIDYPDSLRVGVAWRPVKRLELTFDYEYQYWQGVPPARFTMLEGGLDWDDCNAFKVGVEFKATERLTLMCGYSYGTTVIDNDHVFLNVLSPSIIEHHVGAGVSFAITPRHILHAVYLSGLENSISDSGKGDLFSRFTGGSELRMSGDVVSIGYTYLFAPGKREG